ncbi:peptide-methionine (S)-S-oxide reductase MsrA [Salinimicrobium flavum]|uniref:Peptide methionine sulfoxide reductase MsrA n=1 Tax=Salinimicrobium flavum TaxID=1737065 RepID=A0ABW5J0L9_9FLAO
MENEQKETATLAGGCFWCTEAVFQRVEGVEKVISGFTGGTIKNPPYREVITGRTGHAEAVQIKFDPKKTSFEELLYIFFATHDPTTLNRQQNDVGTQYRSAVFYHSKEQQETAQKVIKKLEEGRLFSGPIITEITEAGPFYEAEQDHHDYYNQNPNQPYCRVIIDPKVRKLQEKFAHKLK